MFNVNILFKFYNFDDLSEDLIFNKEKMLKLIEFHKKRILLIFFIFKS
jgi:hypothetical protein